MFHWQNLTQKYEKSSRRRWPREGRCWWRFGKRHVASIRFEWALFKWSIGAGVEFEPGEGDITFRLSPIFASFYLGFPMPKWVRSHLPRREGTLPGGKPFSYALRRAISFSLYGEYIFWCLWRDDDESSGRGWRQGAFDWKRFILGKSSYETEALEERGVVVPMPEGPYNGRAKLYVSTWRRESWPWWPFTRRLTRCEIKVDRGIPTPGKGENSWDCEDDAIFSITCPAASVEAGVAAMVHSVLRSRKLYGGSGWKPGLRAVVATILLALALALPAGANLIGGF